MAGHAGPRRRHADYTVACICPMGVELAPVEAMLDTIHESLPTSRDQNAYTLGEIGGHNIVVAIMPETGNNRAATTATQLMNDFPSVRIGLLVGIGGGVPGDADIRLGDVVVSQPTGTCSGVVQYDIGKKLDGGRFQRMGQLNKPPAVLCANVRKLDAQYRRLGQKLSQHVYEMVQRYPEMQFEYSFPSTEYDRLFMPAYIHQVGSTCDNCDIQQTVSRSNRSGDGPKIHYGTIGSANILVRDAVLRDELYADMKIMCLEMEAAGLTDDFPCLVIRGISDYADSHKNKRWQPYAAAIAASYMKELLLIIPVQQIDRVERAVKSTTTDFRLGVNIASAPDIPSRLFVGRKEYLQQLADLLLTEPDLSRRKTVIIGGLGGIGKTQLIIQFIKCYHSSYDSVFWLNASSETTLNESLRSIAIRIGIIDLKKERLDDNQIRVQVLNWFSVAQNSRWLLVFDNHDNTDLYNITGFYPFAWQGSIVVTTRSPEHLNGEHVHIGRLGAVSDALHILKTRSGRENILDDVYARRLVQRMDGLPLALATTGSYLRQSTISIADYLEHYEERWDQLRQITKELPEYRDRTLYTTWDLSFIQIQDTRPDAAKLLSLLAYFDKQEIWHQLFAAGNDSRAPAWYSKLADSPLYFEDTMRVLLDFGLAELHIGTMSYGFHACVHDWMLHALNSNLDGDQFRLAFSCVARSIRNTDLESVLSVSDCRRLTPHCTWLCHHQFQASFEGEDVQEQMYVDLETFAALFEVQNKLELAKIQLSRIIAGSEKALEPNDLEFLRVIIRLGKINRLQGRMEQAERIWIQALERYEKVLGSDHGHIVSIVQNLGTLYQERGQYQQAKKMLTRALHHHYQNLGPRHTSTLMTLQNLGVLHFEQNQLKQAERMFSTALVGYEKVLEPDHPDVLRVVLNLGTLYYKHHHFEQAETMWLRALAGYEKWFESDHPDISMVIHNLGKLHHEKGQQEKAEKFLTRALAGLEKMLEPDHPDLLRVVHSVGRLRCGMYQFEEAEKLWTRSVVGFQKVLGPDHWDALTALDDLGLVYWNQDKIELAEKAWIQVLKACEPSRTNHLILLDREAENLVFLYQRQNKLASATEICLQRHQIMTSFGKREETVVIQVVGILTRLILRWSASHALSSTSFNPSLAVANLSKLALDWGDRSISIYGALGRVLLMASDKMNAKNAFQQEIIKEEDDQWVFNAWCDICRQMISCSMKRFICYQCLDLDLCGKCYQTLQQNRGDNTDETGSKNTGTTETETETDPNKTDAHEIDTTRKSNTIPGCSDDHEFFEIQTGIMSPMHSNLNFAGKKIVRTWLEQLLKKYPVEAGKCFDPELRDIIQLSGSEQLSSRGRKGRREEEEGTEEEAEEVEVQEEEEEKDDDDDDDDEEINKLISRIMTI